jgi:hypothetical protein
MPCGRKNVQTVEEKVVLFRQKVDATTELVSDATMSGASSSVLATPACNAANSVASGDLSADVISPRVMGVECSWCAELERGCTWCISKFICICFGRYCKQHFLYFFPLPHVYGSLRPTLRCWRNARLSSWIRSASDNANQPVGTI